MIRATNLEPTLRYASLLLSGFAAFGTFAVACRVEPTTSSETHFLRYCPLEGECPSELTCSCGACGASCTEDLDCASLSEAAVCVTLTDRAADQACAGASAAASCEVPCSADPACASLGPDYRCDRGYCRALAEDCATGEVPGSDVVLLGDNFVPPALTAELERLAHTSGALGSEESYRHHASSVVGPFGGSSDLFAQYDAAVADGVPQVAILDMGGPDALQTCPDPPTEECPSLANAAAGTEQLLAQMAADGVAQVVVFFYPEPEDAVLGAKFDVLRPMIQATCEDSSLACFFLDLRSTFVGHEAEYLDPAGVLPTDAGAVATASAIFSVLQQHCVGQ